MRLNRFFRIHVNPLHKPSWLVGAYRNQGKIHRTKAIRDLLEMTRICGVPAEVNFLSIDVQNVASPKTLVRVEKAATGEMLSRGERDFQTIAYFHRLPPIQFKDMFRAKGFDLFLISKGNKNQWLKAVNESPKRCEIHVIVVVMTDKDNINVRKIIKRNSGLSGSFRANRGERADTFTPNGICQNVVTVKLKKHGRMIYKRDRNLVIDQALI